MIRSGRLRASVALFVLLLVATACSGGDEGGGKATATTQAPTTTGPLPASLASAKGWVSYSFYIGDDERVHVSRVNGAEEHKVAPELPGEIIRADFSHDGQLAFEYRPPADVPQIYVAKADGSGARSIAKPLSEAAGPDCQFSPCERGYPSWSPDSKYLATTASLGAPDSANQAAPPPEMAIGIIDVQTQKVRYILRHPSRAYQPHLPRWSPDGRKLVFHGWRGSKGNPFESTPDAETAVFTVNVDGTGLKQITPWKLRCGDPDWSPDGSMIVCSTYPSSNFDVAHGETYTLKPDGTGLRKLTNFGTSGPRPGQARFTPDGKALLYIRASTQDWDQPQRHVYVRDLTTGQDMPFLTKHEIYSRPSLQP